MWKLPAPDCTNAEAHLKTALTYATEKPKFAYSDNQKANLLSAYEKYDATKGRPDKTLLVRRLGPRFLEAIQQAYNEVQESGRLASLRNNLKIRVQKCPFCGFGEVRDLDHQLPRSVYKAFAIYPKNLIPCCHPCNNKKRSVAGDEPNEQFPHVYLDEMPTERFFFANADISDEGLTVLFEVRPCVDISSDLLQRLRFLVERLELNTRYQAEVNSFITSHRPAIELVAEGGAGSLRDFLLKNFESSARDYGLNHWQTAFWDCLANSDEFCQGGYRHCFGLELIGA